MAIRNFTKEELESAYAELKTVAACPKDLMEAAYLLYKGNITAVGRHFSIGKTTARRYLKQHGII